MTKKLVVFLVALSIVGTAKLWAEEKAPKKAAPAKQPKVVETRLSEQDIGRIEHAISKAVIAKQGPGGWEYLAKKMKPPKNEKWQGKWNDMGADGWEAVDHFENIYIFKRPAMTVSSSARVKPAPAPEKAESAAEMKKEDKAKEKAAKEADKEKEKAAKKAEKEAKKAEKSKEKAAKKAEKKAK